MDSHVRNILTITLLVQLLHLKGLTYDDVLTYIIDVQELVLGK